MADIRAFRAFRYDLGRVGALSDVIAPPYDVIDPALQQALYDRSPYNVIRLILNKEEPQRHRHATTATPAPPAACATGRPTTCWCRTRPARCTSTTRISRSRAGATRAAASWPASAWSRSARAASIRTRKRWPAPRPTGCKLFHATRHEPQPGLRPLPRPRRRRCMRQLDDRRRPGAAAAGDRPPRRRQPAVAGQRSARRQHRHRADGAEAGVHRRRPSSLRDRPALPGRTARRPARCATTRRRPTSS